VPGKPSRGRTITIKRPRNKKTSEKGKLKENILMMLARAQRPAIGEKEKKKKKKKKKKKRKKKKRKKKEKKKKKKKNHEKPEGGKRGPKINSISLRGFNEQEERKMNMKTTMLPLQKVYVQRPVKVGSERAGVSGEERGTAFFGSIETSPVEEGET